jgi:hypothetical protein
MPTAASVQLSVPIHSAATAGKTLTLSAVVRDARGILLPGRQVHFLTDNPDVASVDLVSGVVTANKAGVAQIVCVVDGKVDATILTVSEAQQPAPTPTPVPVPTPTPAPVPTPTPPPAATLFTESWVGDYRGRGWYDGGTLGIVAGPNGAKAVEFHWPKGATTPTSGGAIRRQFTPSDAVFVTYPIRYSANWQGSGQLYHPHEISILSTLDDKWQAPADPFLSVNIEHTVQGGGIRPRLAIQDSMSINTSLGAVPNNIAATTENRSVGGCNGPVEPGFESECFMLTDTQPYNLKQIRGPVVIAPGDSTWHTAAVFAKLNSIANGKGIADGVLQYWFDGKLLIDRHDVLFRTAQHATMQLNQFIIAPYIGDGSPVDQSWFVGPISVSSSVPDSVPVPAPSPTPTPAPEPTPAPVPAPTPTPTPVPTPAPVPDAIDMTGFTLIANRPYAALNTEGWYDDKAPDRYSIARRRAGRPRSSSIPLASPLARHRRCPRKGWAPSIAPSTCRTTRD